MKNHTIEKQAEIGKTLAKILCLKRSKTNKERYQTTWGDKTALGIFNTINRLAEEIAEGKEITI